MAPGHPTDRSRLPEMERLAHSINGAGAMFGFPGLSSAAAEVEHRRFAIFRFSPD
jgi:chemotaxis protein histidine kinase CheA